MYVLSLTLSEKVNHSVSDKVKGFENVLWKKLFDSFTLYFFCVRLWNVESSAAQFEAFYNKVKFQLSMLLMARTGSNGLVGLGCIFDWIMSLPLSYQLWRMPIYLKKDLSLDESLLYFNIV